jgi:Skp family chaperone for outer membrane proteins
MQLFSTKDGEIQEERKEFESFKRKLQRQLTQLEEEMDAQKRELTLGKFFMKMV